MSTLSKKMCLIGDFGVGKTSLIRRYVERQFSDQYLSTVGVKISRKTLEVLPQQALASAQQTVSLQLIIWDIEGDTKFKAIAPSYLQGASSAIIVADSTRPETVTHLEKHVQLFLTVNPKACVAIALNKLDLVESNKLAHLLELAQINHPNIVGNYSTSAKTGENVDLVFQTLAQKLIN